MNMKSWFKKHRGLLIGLRSDCTIGVLSQNHNNIGVVETLRYVSKPMLSEPTDMKTVANGGGDRA